MSTPSTLAILLDRAAVELDHAAEAAAQPLSALATEARALAQALRCCPDTTGLPALAENLAARLARFELTGARASARVAQATRVLRGGDDS